MRPRTARRSAPSRGLYPSTYERSPHLEGERSRIAALTRGFRERRWIAERAPSYQFQPAKLRDDTAQNATFRESRKDPSVPHLGHGSPPHPPVMAASCRRRASGARWRPSTPVSSWSAAATCVDPRLRGDDVVGMWRVGTIGWTRNVSRGLVAPRHTIRPQTTPWPS